MSGVELGLAIVATVDLCLKFEPQPNQNLLCKLFADEY